MHRRPWLLVLGATFAYDTYLICRHDDSLSRHFYLASRQRPLAVTAAVSYLLAHLYGVLPARGDALRYAGATLGSRRGVERSTTLQRYIARAPKKSARDGGARPCREP